MPVTKAICGHNRESHIAAGGKGTAADPISAILAANALFNAAFADANKSLKRYAAQPCPKKCRKKTPVNPVPVWGNFQFSLTSLPPKLPGRPTTEWTCIIGMEGVVEFDCEKPDDDDDDVRP